MALLWRQEKNMLGLQGCYPDAKTAAPISVEWNDEHREWVVIFNGEIHHVETLKSAHLVDAIDMAVELYEPYLLKHQRRDEATSELADYITQNKVLKQ